MNYPDFGIKVRVALLQKGMKMNELAKNLGITPAYLSDILKGSRKGTEQCKKIAELLEMPSQ